MNGYLYSLGCVLYRLCTGELPFKGDSAISLLMALAIDQPKSPREINPDVPPPLADLILRLLAKEPAQRPATVADVAQALQDVTAEKTVEHTVALSAVMAPAPSRRRRKCVGAKGATMTSLNIGATQVFDLSLLKDMKLTYLKIDWLPIADLSPLKGMPLKDLSADFKLLERNADILRSIKTLEKINNKSAAEFWKEVDAKAATKKP